MFHFSQDDLQNQLDAFGDLSEEIENLQQDITKQEEGLKNTLL